MKRVIRPVSVDGSGTEKQSYRITINAPAGTFFVAGSGGSVSTVNCGTAFVNPSDHTQAFNSAIWNRSYFQVGNGMYVSASSGFSSPALDVKIYGVDSSGADLYLMNTSPLIQALLPSLANDYGYGNLHFATGGSPIACGVRFELRLATNALDAHVFSASVTIPSTITLIGA